MRLLPALVAAVVLAAASRLAVAGPEPNGCGVCHGLERTQFEASVHRTASVGCVTCHGGDPTTVASKEAAHDRSKGFRGVVTRRDVAEACGNCHADIVRMRPYGLRTDALAAYRTSHHGKAMLVEGKSDAATCTDCHGVHDVLRTSDPKSPAYRVNVPQTCGRCHGDAAMMERHGIRTTAVTDFAQSVHGTKLARGEPGVPSCADCHDAHAASPPGATEVADVCGSCHEETRDRFREGPHFTAFSRGSMHQCITCHGNHAVGRPNYGLFDAAEDGGPDEGTGTRCLTCHDASNPADKGAATGREFGSSFRGVEGEIADCDARIDGLAALGFRVEEQRDLLDRARRELVRSLPLTHTCDVARVEGALRHVKSLVHEATAACDGKVREARDRRIFGSAAGLVLLVASAFLVLRGRRPRR